MNRTRKGLGRDLVASHATTVVCTLILLALLAGGPVGAAGQSLYGSPEAGWSEVRGFTLGGRVGAEIVGGLDFVLQGLVYFPDEAGAADPGISVSRSSWQMSSNAIYVFDKSRSLAPYVGVGLRYGRAGITLVVEGLRATEVRSGFGANFIGGIRLPALPAEPFIEYRAGDEQWTVTGGVHWSIGRR